MDFDFNSDQVLLAETLNRWSSGRREIPAGSRTLPFLDGAALAEELAGQGFYEAASVPELGVIGAIMLIEAAGSTPYAIETGATALVAPMLGLEGLSRPLAIMKVGGAQVARFLAAGGAALIDAGDHIRLLRCDERVESVKSPYAYPVGRFRGDLVAASRALNGVAVGNFRYLRTLALTAEALAAMDAALALTVEHVISRVQFGRPIGSFQAVQHRLAECSALLQGVRLLLYRAAVEGAGYAGEAAIVAHDAVKRVVYDSGQFHGALGLTLEYPLHLWTYRLRALQTELAQAETEALA